MHEHNFHKKVHILPIDKVSQPIDRPLAAVKRHSKDRVQQASKTTPTQLNTRQSLRNEHRDDILQSLHLTTTRIVQTTH